MCLAYEVKKFWSLIAPFKGDPHFGTPKLQGCSRDRLVRDLDRDRDQSRSRFWLRDREQESSRPRPRPEKWRHHCFFRFQQKFLELKFAHKLSLWLYKLSQMTKCFSLSDCVIKTSRRHHFMHIFTEIIFEKCQWPTKLRWLHMSSNSEKIRGTTFARRLVYLNMQTATACWRHQEKAQSFTPNSLISFLKYLIYISLDCESSNWAKAKSTYALESKLEANILMRLSIKWTLQSNQSLYILRNLYVVPNLGIVVMLLMGKNAAIT